MPIAAQENDVACLCLCDQVEKPLASFRKIGPLFVAMLARDHLNPRSDQVNVGGAGGELAFEPSPLVLAEHVGVRSGPFTKISAVEEDDFHLSTGRPETVGRKDAGLLAARAFRRLIEKIEQEPLALDLCSGCFSRPRSRRNRCRPKRRSPGIEREELDSPAGLLRRDIAGRDRLDHRRGHTRCRRARSRGPVCIRELVSRCSCGLYSRLQEPKAMRSSCLPAGTSSANAAPQPTKRARPTARIPRMR